MTDTQASYDVILVGGGHNGLVCASYLAKSGRNVLVLEANEALGGAATTREFGNQFQVSACAQWLYQLNPQVAAEMQLEKHGLEFAARDLDTIALAEDGEHITLGGNGISGQNLSETDRAAYQQFNKQMLKFSRVLAAAFSRRAPKLVDGNWTDRLTLAQLGLRVKLLGKQDMNDFLRLLTMNIYDVMDEHFDHPLLQAAISLDAVLGTHLGPRSPNTLFTYLYRRLGDIYGFNGPAVVKGGMGAVGEAFARSARASGVTIRTGSRVEKINLEIDQVTGVTLASGEVIDANIVVSNADPKTTLGDLVGYRNIETGVARRVSNIRMKGTAAKLHLALSALPQFTGLSEKQTGQRLIIAPTMNSIETAFNHVKYGEYSSAPVLDISIPTLHDASLAPGGQHVLTAIVQYAPHQLKAGWDTHKDRFRDIVIDRIAEYAPGIKDLIVASELLTPQDLESEFHMTGGHWHHGEMGLDQILMMRPFPGASQYATSVDGLFLCGAGTHPGGGVMGLAGRNAANEIIKRGRSA